MVRGWGDDSSSASAPGRGREGPGKQEEYRLSTASTAAAVIIIIIIVITFIPTMATHVPAAPGEMLTPVKQEMDPPVGPARGCVNVCDCICLCPRPSVCPCLHVCRMCVSRTRSPHPLPLAPHPTSEQFPTSAFRSLGGSLAVPLSLPSTHPTSISRHITPYIHEFSCLSGKVMHENGGWERGRQAGGRKQKQPEKKKFNRVNADGGGGRRWGGGGSRLGVALCKAAHPVLGGRVHEDPHDSISPLLFFSFLFSLSIHTSIPTPLHRLPPPSPHPHPLPRCLSLFSSLLRTVKAGYRQRSAPS